jgi:hypothetical protein
LIGAASHIRQFEIRVTANNKAEALAFLKAAGLYIPGHLLRIQSGQSSPNKALTQAGLLTEPGTVLVYRAFINNSRVVRADPGTEPAVVAHFKFANRSKLTLIAVAGPPPETTSA